MPALCQALRQVPTKHHLFNLDNNYHEVRMIIPVLPTRNQRLRGAKGDLSKIQEPVPRRFGPNPVLFVPEIPV